MKNPHTWPNTVVDSNPQEVPSDQQGCIKDIGKVLGLLRKTRKITRSQLARNASLQRSTVSRIESGEIKGVSLETLRRMAMGMNISLSRLFAESEGLNKNFSPEQSLNRFYYMWSSEDQGVKISSCLPRGLGFFCGQLEMLPQKSLTRQEIGSYEVMILRIWEGKLVFISQGKQTLLRTGDCWHFFEPLSFELYNPDAIKSAKAFLVSKSAIF